MPNEDNLLVKPDPNEIFLRQPHWQRNPKVFCKEVLNVKKIWRMQQDMLSVLPKAIRERKEIYVASGHALGKDYISAAISLWFLYSFTPSMVILTGPTDRQVKNIMWKEVTSHWNARRLDLGGRLYMDPRIEIEKDWFMLGFTTKETGQTKEGGGGKFQGYHAPNVCVIVTEAQSVEDEIFDQIDAITTSQNVLIIFIGNPTRAKGRFAQGLKNKSRNLTFHFSCLENPNYTERREIVPGLCSYAWVEKMREKWGEDDPRWIGRVLGQVPNISINSVFSEELIERMKARHGFLAQHSAISGVAVDPAGEGGDPNVFMAGAGGEVTHKFQALNMPPSEAAMKAVAMCRLVKGNFIVVDCDGIGIGVFQELKKFPDGFMRGIFILKFHGSSTLTVLEGGKKIYANLRAEAAWVARDRARRGHAAVNPKDEELIEELEADEYFENKRGEIQLLDKDDIKLKIDNRSPGSADAWKMFQWAVNQDLEEDSYADSETNPQPAYAVTETDDSQDPDPEHPRYGLTN